jgi:Flp pilus assembly protein TadG
MGEKMNLQGREGGKPKRGERGQSLVETAVVFPILVLLLAAIIDFGRAFDAYIILTNAAREGARFGSTNPELPEADVKQLVVDDVLGSGTNVTRMTGFGLDNVAVTGQHEGSTEVVVTVTFQFDLWFGRLIGIPQLTLTKTAEMPRWRAGE